MVKYDDELKHFGILGMKWGIRRYQNPDGTLTEEGRKRYGSDSSLRNKNIPQFISEKGKPLADYQIENIKKTKHFQDDYVNSDKYDKYVRRVARWADRYRDIAEKEIASVNKHGGYGNEETGKLFSLRMDLDNRWYEKWNEAVSSIANDLKTEYGKDVLWAGNYILETLASEIYDKRYEKLGGSTLHLIT